MYLVGQRKSVKHHSPCPVTAVICHSWLRMLQPLIACDGGSGLGYKVNFEMEENDQNCWVRHVKKIGEDIDLKSLRHSVGGVRRVTGGSVGLLQKLQKPG